MLRDEYGMGYSFRFRNLSTELSEKLVEELKIYNARYGSKSNPDGEKVVSFELNDNVDPNLINTILEKYCINTNDTDIFASLLAINETGIAGTPQFLIRFLSSVPTNLNFSYTFVLDD